MLYSKKVGGASEEEGAGLGEATPSSVSMTTEGPPSQHHVDDGSPPITGIRQVLKVSGLFHTDGIQNLTCFIDTINTPTRRVKYERNNV